MPDNQKTGERQCSGRCLERHVLFLMSQKPNEGLKGLMYYTFQNILVEYMNSCKKE